MAESKYYIVKLEGVIFRQRLRDFELSLPNQYEHVGITYNGSFGFVIIWSTHLKTLNSPIRAYRELSVLQLHNHPNLIRALDIYTPANSVQSLKEIYIVTEFMDQTLRDSIKYKTELTHGQISFLVYQILAGLNYLKKMGIVHRDLKPENILTNLKCQLKIIDFGLAREQVDSIMTTHVVTAQYRAPDIFLMPHYSYKSDMWSVGCIFVELFTKKTLFYGVNCEDRWEQNYVLWKQMVDKFGKMPEDFWKRTRASVPPKFKTYSDESRSELTKLIRSNQFPQEEKPILTNESALKLIEHMLVIDPDEREDSEINCEPKGKFKELGFDKTVSVDAYKAPIYELIQKCHRNFDEIENTDSPQPSTSSQNTQPETLFTASSIENQTYLNKHFRSSFFEVISVETGSENVHTFGVQGNNYQLLDRYVNATKLMTKVTTTHVSIKLLQIDYLYETMYAKYKLLLSDMHRNQNIVQLQHYYTSQSLLNAFNEIYIVMDYMDTTLKGLIDTNTNFQHKQLSSIIKQILDGLRHLDQMNVVYGNLRPEFIFVNQQLELKLTDFGVIFDYADQEKLLQVYGHDYISPEIEFHVKCDSKASVWSVGCIFIELVFKYPIFHGDNIIQWDKTVSLVGNAKAPFLNKLKQSDRDWIMKRQSKFAPTFYDVLKTTEFPPTSSEFPRLTGKFMLIVTILLFTDLAELALDLISKMLKIDPDDRCSIKGALNHVYLNSLRFVNVELPNINPADIAIIYDTSSETKRRLFDKLRKN
ncbi:Mitogen-activated protein kinase [Aphelenchoides bicaudatus]|nr:Mitogen-activated protein kinase [Aphelenchoides bicaudatus]